MGNSKGNKDHTGREFYFDCALVQRAAEGAVPSLMVLVARTGHEIVSAETLSLDAQGALIKVDRFKRGMLQAKLDVMRAAAEAKKEALARVESLRSQADTERELRQQAEIQALAARCVPVARGLLCPGAVLRACPLALVLTIGRSGREESEELRRQ